MDNSSIHDKICNGVDENQESVTRIANFIDNFSDFMYHTINETMNTIPENSDKSTINTFLTSLRKEVADFHSRVNSLREEFKV